MHATVALFVFLVLTPYAALAVPPPAVIEKVAACRTKEDRAGVELIVKDTPASTVRDRLVAATGIRLMNGDAIGSSTLTVSGLGCLPLRAALSLLADAGGSGAEPRLDADGTYRLVNLPHHAEIDRLREAAANLAGTDAVQRRALLEKIVALAPAPTAADAEEFVGDAYRDLYDMAFEAKDYARAETLARAWLAQVERVLGKGDSERGVVLAALAYAHQRLGRDGSLAELERALDILSKADGERAAAETARAASTLAEAALEAKQRERAESFATIADATLSRPDMKNCDRYALYEARFAAGQTEMRLGSAFAESDRDADAARHFERALKRWEELERPDALLAFPRELVATLSENAQALDDVGAYYAKAGATLHAANTADEATALWALALVRAKQQRWDEAIAAWQHQRTLRRQVCQGDARAERSGRTDLELLYALGGKTAPAETPLPAAEGSPANACAHGRLAQAITRDLAPFLVEHYRRVLAEASDDDTRQRAEEAKRRSGTAVLRQNGMERPSLAH